MKIGDSFEYIHAGSPTHDPDGIWTGRLIVTNLGESNSVFANPNDGSMVGMFFKHDRINEVSYKFAVGDKVFDEEKQMNGFIYEIDYIDDYLPYKVLFDDDNFNWATEEQLSYPVDGVELKTGDKVFLAFEHSPEINILTDSDFSYACDDEITTNEEIAILLQKQTFDERNAFVAHLGAVLDELAEATGEEVDDNLVAKALSIVAEEILE